MAPRHKIGDEPFTIDKWLVIGPFQLKDGQPDSRLDMSQAAHQETARKYIAHLLEHDFLNGEADVQPSQGDKVDDKEWKAFPSASNGVIDFNEVFGNTHIYAVAYAYCVLDNRTAEPRNVELSVNSDDGAANWINGKQIWFNPALRTMAVSSSVPATLQPGLNYCLVKVANALEGWQFALHVTPLDSAYERSPDLGQIQGMISLRPAGWQQGDLEQPLAGVQVTLTRLRPPQAQPVAAERLREKGVVFGQNQPWKLPSAPLNYVTSSDRLGRYSFSNLEPGSYTLAFPSRLQENDLGLPHGQLSLALGSARSTIPVAANSVINHPVTYAEAFYGEVRGIVFRDPDGSGSRMGHEPTLTQVAVALFDQAGRQAAGPAFTDQFGEYRFANVPPGDYSLRFADLHAADGEELRLSTSAVLPISVAVAAAVQAPPTGYQPEVHEIRGRVRYEDGTAAAGIIVRLMDLRGNVELSRMVTDHEGSYRFEHVQGQYLLVFPEDPDADVLATPARLAAQVNSIFMAPDTIYRLGGGGGNGRGNGIVGGGPLQESLADIASYMPTTHEESGPALRRTGGASGGGNLQQLVDGALTAVLGRRLKTDDPKLFRASLKRAFTLEQQHGRPTYVWTPRSYAVQTELGGELTGAQASLYHRAKIALDDALPLLRGLEPLIPSPDREETEAVRGIIRTQMSELVEELGAEGGPRVQRVDSLFQMLAGHFERMQQAFGFDDRFVNSVDEERRLTDFFVIRDYVGGLRSAWEGENGFRRQFTGERRFLGTQLVLLSRALSVVAESVDEAYQAMDAVALGPAERQTVRIDFPTHVRLHNETVPVIEHGPERGTRPPSQLIEELLSWVLRFATDEGRMLIEEGGRQGVMAMQPTARQLQLLVQGAAEARVSHVGFSRTRVRRALNELATQLGQVDRLARELDLRSA